MTIGRWGFATIASRKADFGYKNIYEALFVAKKYGKLVPKSDLPPETVKELNSAVQKKMESFVLREDTFVKTIK